MSENNINTLLQVLDFYIFAEDPIIVQEIQESDTTDLKAKVELAKQLNWNVYFATTHDK